MGDHTAAFSSDDQAQRDLLALNQRWAAAIVSNDAAAIAHFMADDWIIVSENGMTRRGQFLSVVESGELTHDAMNMIEGTARVRIYGEHAVVTARVTSRATYKGATFDADEWTTDVFRRVGSEWKCVLSHITAAKAES